MTSIPQPHCSENQESTYSFEYAPEFLAVWNVISTRGPGIVEEQEAPINEFIGTQIIA